MRKPQINQILSVVSDMHTAHDEIKKAAEENNIILLQNQMCDLQEVAVSLGEIIEKSEGEGFVTVSYLEKYCEELYMQLQKLQEGNANPYRVKKDLDKRLIAVENSVKNDIPVRKEIVFFPYKASMWDSLESIYLRLKEDKNNDVYCVPIPYYELNPDHSIGRMHYEGREYPKNIEVIDYKTYNFEERNLDEIYIHNPYDNWNLVTQVDKRFFSANLKAHTPKLVYSPYFVLKEIEPDDQHAIEGIKHFIWTPGVINADEVILQSEKMKQIYVNEYLKAAKENGLGGCHIDRKYLENKFKGTGSPKIEKILRTKREDLEIPKEWQDIINKPDGSKKKVILYNTGIAALLAHNEKWVKKIEDSLEIFKENKDDVALLWRPHPLIENSMKSMRPWILQKYTEIKNKYIAEGWGIYDDTADLDRAVALSDAYYGDGSSVVELYTACDKKVLLSIEMNLNDRTMYNLMSSWSSVVHNGFIYLFSEYSNIMFEINIDNLDLINIYTVPTKINNELFISFTVVNDDIWIAPYNADDGYIFNTVTKRFSVIDLELNCKTRLVQGKYSKVFYLDKFVYFLGENICEITKINVETREVFHITSYKEIFNSVGIAGIQKININQEIEISSFLFGENYYLYGTKMYLHMRHINYILIYDLKNDCFDILKIDVKGNANGTSYMFGKGNMLYIYGYGKEFAIYNLDDNVLRHKEYIEDDATDGIRNIVKHEKKEYGFYSNGKIVLHYDEQHKLIENIFCSEYKREGMVVRGFVCKTEKYIFFQNRITGELGILDIEKDKIKKWYVHIEGKKRKEIVESIINSSSICNDHTISLKDFLYIIGGF